MATDYNPSSPPVGIFWFDGTNWRPVSAADPLPVNASVTLSPTALQNVNITQVGSATAAVGHGVAATALRVELPTDGTGVVGAQGLAASGATAAGNPVLMGARAATADPTAVTNGQAANIMTDKIGRFINAGFAIPENYLDGFISSTATTAATIIASPGAAASIYVTDLELSNTSTTQSVITLNNTAATQLAVPANGGREIHLQTPIKIAANTALTFTCAPAVTALLVGAQGYKGV